MTGRIEEEPRRLVGDNVCLRINGQGDLIDVQPDGPAQVRVRMRQQDGICCVLVHHPQGRSPGADNAFLDDRRVCRADVPAVLPREFAKLHIRQLEGFDERIALRPAGLKRIRAICDLPHVGRPVAVRIRVTRGRSVQIDLDRVGESVSVRITGKRIRPVPELLEVAEPVAVGIAGTVAVKRAEMAELPFVRHLVAVGGKSDGTHPGDHEVVQVRLDVAAHSEAREPVRAMAIRSPLPASKPFT